MTAPERKKTPTVGPNWWKKLRGNEQLTVESRVCDEEGAAFYSYRMPDSTKQHDHTIKHNQAREKENQENPS